MTIGSRKMSANQEKKERKVRFVVISNVLTDANPLRVPLKTSLTVADASAEILSRICEILNITEDKAKLSSLCVGTANGQRLCGRDTLNDALESYETTLYAEILNESAASAASSTKPTQEVTKQGDVKVIPPPMHCT